MQAETTAANAHVAERGQTFAAGSRAMSSVRLSRLDLYIGLSRATAYYYYVEPYALCSPRVAFEDGSGRDRPFAEAVVVWLTE